jgi:hypothetical protein
LGIAGFKDIGKLMIHQKDGYLKFLIFGPDHKTGPKFTTYSNVLQDHFSEGGRSMIPESYFRNPKD